MSAKPSYLGLLNAIAVAEGQAERYLEAWADVTGDAEVADTLRFVAAREGEHSKAFAKRLVELGFSVRWASDPEVVARNDEDVAYAASGAADAEKFEHFDLGKPQGETDLFDDFFKNKTLDPHTGALLGRYIAEERDSQRRLAACRNALAATAGSAAASR